MGREYHEPLLTCALARRLAATWQLPPGAVSGGAPAFRLIGGPRLWIRVHGPYFLDFMILGCRLQVFQTLTGRATWHNIHGANGMRLRP